MVTLDELIAEAQGDLVALADNNYELRKLGKVHAIQLTRKLERLNEELAELQARLEANEHEQKAA